MKLIYYVKMRIYRDRPVENEREGEKQIKREQRERENNSLLEPRNSQKPNFKNFLSNSPPTLYILFAILSQVTLHRHSANVFTPLSPSRLDFSLQISRKTINVFAPSDNSPFSHFPQTRSNNIRYRRVFIIFSFRGSITAVRFNSRMFIYISVFLEDFLVDEILLKTIETRRVIIFYESVAVAVGVRGIQTINFVTSHMYARQSHSHLFSLFKPEYLSLSSSMVLQNLHKYMMLLQRA